MAPQPATLQSAGDSICSMRKQSPLCQFKAIRKSLRKSNVQFCDGWPCEVAHIVLQVAQLNYLTAKALFLWDLLFAKFQLKYLFLFLVISMHTLFDAICE